MFLCVLCVLHVSSSPEQPGWAAADGEPEDESAQASCQSEEEWDWTTEQLTRQNTQPHTHMAATRGNTHKRTNIDIIG